MKRPLYEEESLEVRLRSKEHDSAKKAKQLTIWENFLAASFEDQVDYYWKLYSEEERICIRYNEKTDLFSCICLFLSDLEIKSNEKNSLVFVNKNNNVFYIGLSENDNDLIKKLITSRKELEHGTIFLSKVPRIMVWKIMIQCVPDNIIIPNFKKEHNYYSQTHNETNKDPNENLILELLKSSRTAYSTPIISGNTKDIFSIFLELTNQQEIILGQWTDDRKLKIIDGLFSDENKKIIKQCMGIALLASFRSNDPRHWVLIIFFF